MLVTRSFSGACCIDRFPALNECSDSGVKETMDLERDVLSRRSAGSARATQNRRAIPPSFSRENFLSGTDNGQFKPIQARTGLRSQGKKKANLPRSPNEFWARF